MRPLALDLCAGLGGWSKGLKASGWDVVAFDIEPWPNPHADQFIQGDIRQVHICHDGNGNWRVSIEPTKKNESWLDWPLPSKPMLVCASPPCQDFSYSSFPFKKAREKFTAENPPDRSIWDACVRIDQEAKAPLILENVRGAVKWMGPAKAHYGSFYLWGDVPALLPIGRPQKGFGRVKEIKNPSDAFGGFGGSSYQSRGNKGPLNAKRDGGFGWNDPEVQNARKNRGFPGEMDRITPVYGGAESKQGKGSSYKKMTGSEKYRRIHGAEQAGHAGTNARKEWSVKAAMIPYELAYFIGEVFHTQDGK